MKMSFTGNFDLIGIVKVRLYRSAAQNKPIYVKLSTQIKLTKNLFQVHNIISKRIFSQKSKKVRFGGLTNFWYKIVFSSSKRLKLC